MTNFKNTPASASPQRQTILYFYLNCGFPDWQLHYNVYEYRFLEFMSKSYDVVVAFFTRDWTQQPDKESLPENCKLLLLPDLPLPKRLPRIMGLPLETVARILKIALFVRGTRPDLIFGNWTTRESGFSCAVAGVHPLVVAAWGTDILLETKQSRILRLFAKLTVHSADQVIVDSEVHREGVLNIGCDPSKVYCFPWGVNLDEFRPQDRTPLRQELGWINDRIIVSTRYQHAIYGVEQLLRAMPRILRKVADAKLLIAGGGPLLNYHKTLVKQLGVRDNVKFLGTVDNKQLPRILNAADVYVSTSITDGSSASLMEALGCGLPVVVTDISANREWIKHGENGFLVPIGDSSTLADDVVKVLQDNGLRLRMSEANLKLARERADWKTNSLALGRCVNDLTAQAG